MENLSKRYTKKSSDLYHKLKEVKEICFINKGIEKNNSKKYEKTNWWFNYSKKEESKFKKSGLDEVWKKIDLIDDS